MTTVTIIHPDTSDKIVVSPMAISIPMGELNENLQHVAQTCQATLAYEPELLELLALKTDVAATVEDEYGRLFTGSIDTGVTWTDNGFPTPIDAIQVKIQDNTRLLDRQATDEVALIGTTVAAAVRRICADCGVTIKDGAKLPLATLQAFVLDQGASYLQALNSLLFQHQAAFLFTPDGELDIIDFAAIPSDLPLLGADKILTGLSPTRTAKKFDAVKIGYTPLTRMENQQVYFEGNDLGDDNTPLVPIDFTAAILSVAPYSEVGKSAYGRFSLTHPLGGSNVFTVDFWIQYIWAENQVLLDIGVPSDRIQIICSSGEPNYNEPQDGEPPYNWEIESADRLPYNVAAGSAVYANHQGQSAFDTIDLEDIGFEFTPNTWEHLAVVLTDTEITLYLRDRMLPFARYGTGIQEATAVLNAGEMSFQLDELLVDTTRARDFADFVEGTHDKVPWAALDHTKRHYILDAAEPDNITGNLFTSRAFERAVLRVLENNKEAL